GRQGRRAAAGGHGRSKRASSAGHNNRRDSGRAARGRSGGWARASGKAAVASNLAHVRRLGRAPPELRAGARGGARCRGTGAAKRRLPPAWGETGAGWPPLTACALRVVTTYRHAGGKDRAGPVGASCLTYGGGLGSVSGIRARARAREGRPDAGGGWAPRF